MGESTAQSQAHLPQLASSSAKAERTQLASNSHNPPSTSALPVSNAPISRPPADVRPVNMGNLNSLSQSKPRSGSPQVSNQGLPSSREAGGPERPSQGPSSQGMVQIQASRATSRGSEYPRGGSPASHLPQRLPSKQFPVSEMPRREGPLGQAPLSQNPRGQAPGQYPAARPGIRPFPPAVLPRGLPFLRGPPLSTNGQMRPLGLQRPPGPGQRPLGLLNSTGTGAQFRPGAPGGAGKDGRGPTQWNLTPNARGINLAPLRPQAPHLRPPNSSASLKVELTPAQEQFARTRQLSSAGQKLLMLVRTGDLKLPLTVRKPSLSGIRT